jgi:hypothetical protein
MVRLTLSKLCAACGDWFGSPESAGGARSEQTLRRKRSVENAPIVAIGDGAASIATGDLQLGDGSPKPYREVTRVVAGIVTVLQRDVAQRDDPCVKSI